MLAMDSTTTAISSAETQLLLTRTGHLMAPPKVPDASPISTTRRLTLRPGQIIVDAAFRGRAGGVQRAHVKTLMKAMRNTRRVPPPLIWDEVDKTGKTTGRYILLDGLHRVRAWENLSAGDPERRSRGIAVQVFTGSKAQASLRAAEPNTRDSLPWSERERMAYAYRTVIEFRRTLTMEAVSQATSVCARSVSNMRKLLDALTTAGKEPTGDLFRDRQALKGIEGGGEFPDDMTEEALDAAAADAAKAFLATTKLRLPRDRLVIFRAFGMVLGTQGVRDFAEYQFGGSEALDEFRDDSMDEPTEALSGLDF